MPGPAATSTPPLIVPLDQAAGLGLGADRIGSKAANLARLVAAGFPIPPSFVIPADAFADWPQVQAALPAAASHRVTSYQQHHQRPQDQPAMAVLVQRMVHPDAAGVAFTANPVTGARDEIVVTAVRGLGERLVAGEATGDQWVIRHGQAHCTRQTEQAITADQTLAVASLARRVEQHFRVPRTWSGRSPTTPCGCCRPGR